MFRAAYCSSSGVLNCICILWFIYPCGDWPLSRLSGKNTCWAFNKRCNNKFYYKVASGWLFLLIQSSYILWCIVLLSSNYYHSLFAHADLSKPAECKEQSWWFIRGWLFAILKENAREADLAPKVPVVSTSQVHALLIFGYDALLCDIYPQNGRNYICFAARVSLARQDEGERSYEERYPGPPGWGLRRWTSTLTLAKMFLS